MFRRRPWHPTTHQSLRIVDASTIPSIISGNPNSTVLAIAERAATYLTSESDTSWRPSLRPVDG
ncbi:GMC oxidoreductase [Streptomyces malaysiensis]|uniref:GMC oxidoreductase n=1 Tax=Streptomyces malaysiensis TaxID=92644 RepID=UPI000C9CCC16